MEPTLIKKKYLVFFTKKRNSILTENEETVNVK